MTSELITSTVWVSMCLTVKETIYIKGKKKFMAIMPKQ